MDRYTYKIGLPDLGADDVISRELHYLINGEESIHIIEDVNLSHWEVVLEENSVCKMWIVDIDDAGNRSADGAVLEFVVVDIVPPSAPSAPVIADVVPVVENPTV